MSWKDNFDHEIQNGLEVRNRGNEGQARVYARRAAGIALREYFQQRELPIHSASAYDLLKTFLEIPGQPTQVRQAAEYLTQRVNADFNLPATIDLLHEAQFLAASLLPDPSGRLLP